MTFGPKTTNDALTQELQGISGYAGLTEVSLTLAEGEALEEAARRLRKLTPPLTAKVYTAADEARTAFLRDVDFNDQIGAIAAAVDAAFKVALR